MNGDNSLHNSIYILLNLELHTFLTILLQGNVIIQCTINLRKLNFLLSVNVLDGCSYKQIKSCMGSDVKST